MRKTNILCLLLGLTLSVTSCNKETHDASQQTETSVEGHSKHVGSRDSVLVNLTIGVNSEELRLAQSVNAEGVPFNPFMEEKDVVIRFAVRKNHRVTYTNAVCKKLPGENKVSYKGIIRLPDLGYGSTPPSNLTGHEIAGVLLGEANNGTQFVEEINTYTVKTIEQNSLITEDNSIVRSKVPYILDWTAFPLTADGKQEEKLNLHFKPIGNLLRIQFKNNLDAPQDIKSFKITSNVLATECYIDFSSRRLTRDVQAENIFRPVAASGTAIVSWSENYELEKTYQLTTPVRVESKGKTQWYYLWVMPLVYNRLSGYDDLFPRTQVVAQTNDGKEHNVLAICNLLEEGTNSVTMSFKTTSTLETAFKGGKLPLWYFAEYDVAPNGVSLAHTNTPSYRYINDARQLTGIYGYFDDQQLDRINVPGYHVPDAYQMAIIHGFQVRRPNPINGHLSYTHGRAIEHVLFPGEKNPTEVTSEYKTVVEKVEHPDGFIGDRITYYALRFEQCGERDKLTAYRYHFNEALFYEASLAELSGDRTFEVSSVFLGSGFTGDISTISTPSFWSNRSDIVKRVFPLSGYIQNDPYSPSQDGAPPYQGHRLGKNVDWYFTVQDMSTNAAYSSINMAEPATYNRSYEFRAPVRVIKNEFKTAK